MDIRSQPVAYVDHRMQAGFVMQQECFADPRCEVEMLAENAATQRAGDHQPITITRPAAKDRAAGSGFAEHGYRDNERAIPGVGIAADDGDIEVLGDRFHSTIEILGEYALCP